MSRPRSLDSLETLADVSPAFDPGRATQVPLVYNGGFGFPTKLQGAVAGPTWRSPDGTPKEVRIQLQGMVGGDGLSSIVAWQVGQSVWCKIRFWVKGAAFTSPFITINGGPIQAFNCIADRVEVYYYGVCTTNAPPFNGPVTVNCGIGESQSEPTFQTQFARYQAGGIAGTNALAISNAANVFRVRCRADIPPLTTAMNAGFQAGSYVGNTPANANLITLSGAPNVRIGGIQVSIKAAGVLGTSTYVWSLLPFDVGNAAIIPWQLDNSQAPAATAAGPVALGNTGMSISFAAGAYAAGEQYLFPALRVWPMLFDATANPAAATTPVSVGPEMNPYLGYQADWVIDPGVTLFQGAYVGLSTIPLNYQPPANFGYVTWDIEASQGG